MTAMFTTSSPNFSSIVLEENITGNPGPQINFCTDKPPKEQWEVDLSFYLNGVVSVLVIVLGLIGNSLTVIVLLNKTMRTSTNCFLMALAIWDSMVLFVTFFLISLTEFSDAYLRTAFPYVVAFIYPLGLVAQTITIWLTVSFTVERYIAVCHPLKAVGMCTINRARMVIVGVCFVSLLFNVSRWLEYRVVPFHFLPTNDTCNIINPTELSQDTMYHKIYFGWAYFLIMCVIPLLSLAILNTFLILAVRKSREQQKGMNVRQSRENNVTIMLISVVLLFMLFQVPALIYNMAYAINMNSVRSAFGWKILSSIRNFLVNVNSAVNFILYCALGQKFRRTFVRTFCPSLNKTMNNFNSFSNAHKMDKVKGNGNTKYVKMAGRGKPVTTTSTTEDSGVVTKCGHMSRYSQHSNGSDHGQDKKVDERNINKKTNPDKILGKVEEKAVDNGNKAPDKDNDIKSPSNSNNIKVPDIDNGIKSPGNNNDIKSPGKNNDTAVKDKENKVINKGNETMIVDTENENKILNKLEESLGGNSEDNEKVPDNGCAIKITDIMNENQVDKGEEVNTVNIPKENTISTNEKQYANNDTLIVEIENNAEKELILENYVDNKSILDDIVDKKFTLSKNVDKDDNANDEITRLINDNNDSILNNNISNRTSQSSRKSPENNLANIYIPNDNYNNDPLNTSSNELAIPLLLLLENSPESDIL